MTETCESCGDATDWVSARGLCGYCETQAERDDPEADPAAAAPAAPVPAPVETEPVFGSQTADNAAWAEVRAAIAAEPLTVRLDDETIENLTGAVVPVLARLVDQARAQSISECGEELRAAGTWEEVSVLIRGWLNLPLPEARRA